MAFMAVIEGLGLISILHTFGVYVLPKKELHWRNVEARCRQCIETDSETEVNNPQP